MQVRPNVNQPHPNRSGFTLVEVLMVIAIIGILVGLIVPAVNMALTSVKRKAIALEVQAIESAVQQYKNKFGDFPPDGSSQSVWERHFRKVFPQMQASEFTALYTNTNSAGPLPHAPATGGAVMDPAEALVFCLGGYSSNPIQPFTGAGGPLSLVPGKTTYQYNTERTGAFYDFKQSQLTLDSSGGMTVSNDEAQLYSGGVNDLIPVYHPASKLMPFVYFESRTYSFIPGGATATYFNYFQPTLVDAGVARPYKSDSINTNVSQASAPDAYYKYAEDKGFQIISAGLDDLYGGVVGVPNSGTPRFYRYPSGTALNITLAPGAQTGPSRYVESAGIPSAQLDNATNFSEGTLGDALEN